MTISNLGKIHVMRMKTTTPTTTVIKNGLLIKTAGDSVVVLPPVTDAIFQPQVARLQTMYTGFKQVPPTYTSSQVNIQKGIVVVSYNKNMAYIESVSQDEAISAGDINAGIAVVLRVGAKLGKKGSNKKTDFGVTDIGVNFIQVHAKKDVKGNQSHKWRIAIVPALGTAPIKGAWVEFTSTECDIIIEGVPAGSFVAINHTDILPVAHAKTGTATTSVPLTGKKAKVIPASKGNHPVFNWLNPDPYTWKGWIYCTAQ